MQNFKYCTLAGLLFGEGIVKKLSQVPAGFGKEAFIIQDMTAV